MKKIILVFVGVLTLTFHTNIDAQTNDGFEAVLFATDDAEKLLGAYIEPAMTGLVFSMNNGWYHTAKVHKLFGFDFSFGLSASVVPSSSEIFRFADLGLSSNITPGAPTAATVAGSNITTPVTFQGSVMDDNGNTVTASASFEMPGGVKDDLPLNAVPAPALQFGIGLPWKFDAMIRVVPEVGSDDVKGSLLGIGLKKEITKWFGPMEKTPLHVSLLAAYTSMNVDYDIQADSSIPGSGQKAEFELNSYTVEAIASLNFPVINIYGGFGYNGGSSDLRMLGTYRLEFDTTLPPPNDTATQTVVDPLNLSFNASGFKTTVGVRLSLGFFKIFGSYTLQEFNTFNGGIAFSFR